MNFWQRALKSISRRKGKSFILFLVIFILGNVIAGAVAIQQSTVNVEKNTKEKLGARAVLDVDYEKYNKDAEKNPELKWPDPLTDKEYQKVAELPQVKYYDMSLSAYIGTSKLAGYTPEDGEMLVGSGANYFFNLKGNNNGQLPDLREGYIKLDQGEMFSEQEAKDGSNVVLISKEVAEANHLKVGDQMVIDATSEMIDMGLIQPREGSTVDATVTEDSAEEPAEAKVVSFDFPVTVKGIFNVARKETKDLSKEEKTQDDWAAADQINTFYMPNKTVQALMDQSLDKFYVNLSEADRKDYQLTFAQATYVLNAPDEVAAFREDAQGLLPKYYAVIADSDQYDQVAGGMKKLGEIAKYVVIIAAVATMLIISLVVLLFLRDRKHELGIYLSLGESRGKIIGQILAELLLVSLLALILSLLTGNLLGGVVSDQLMQTDWINNTQEGIMYSVANGNQSVNFEEVRAAYKVSFTPGYVITYLVLGLGTVLLSAVLPLLYIMRLNPKKIMM
ncbi:FtsX-like permease family protein [Enterococcus sp. AD013-P3]|uniref:ABC transporter permease n=1 Tax=Enterococcus sp. AD013-P3 TaxID=3411036 RepID=UPI003B934E1D